MMVVDRYKDMCRTIDLVREEFVSFQKLGAGLSSSAWVTDLLQNKLSGTPIRAYFVAKTAIWLKSTSPFNSALPYARNERLFSAQLPFVFEVVITIQYLHNQILDGKSGVTSRERISENMLAANLLKEQLYRYISTQLPRSARSSTLEAVRKCFEQVDQGQYLEQQFNTYQAFAQGQQEWKQTLPQAWAEDLDLAAIAPFVNKLKADLPAILHVQLDIYFARIYLTCASLFVEASRLLGQLLKVPTSKMNAVLNFSVCYGLMRQLVNDNSDWIPSRFGLSTKTKTAEDHFSDLRNGTLTLPTFFLLAEKKDSMLLQFLNKQMRWSATFEEAAFTEVLSSNALYKSIQNTRILSELALAYLPHDNDAAAHLADSCEIVHWNKFLAPCLNHPAYQEYRRGFYRQRTRRLILQLRKERTSLQQVPASSWWKQVWELTPETPPAVTRLVAVLQRHPAGKTN